jgi:hypothetical protein
MTEETFNADEVCPESRVYLHHNTITTVRCGRCGLLNPNQCTPPPRRERARPSPGQEIISLDESPEQPKPVPAPEGVPGPSKRRGAPTQGLATIIPTIPDFKLGYAEKERQNADQRIADRKTKTGYTAPAATIHFSVGIAHFTWNPVLEDQGTWAAGLNQWSVNEDNRDITSDGLLTSLLTQIHQQTKRANLRKWLAPDGNGQWSLGHTNPQKQSPRDIVTWAEKRLLSTVIDAGSYEQKVLTGNPRKLITLWLYWLPEEPPAPPPSPPSAPPPPSSARRKPATKTKVKPKPEAIKPEASVPKGTKRPRPVSVGLAASVRPLTRLQNSMVKESEEGNDYVISERDERPAGGNDDVGERNEPAGADDVVDQ